MFKDLNMDELTKVLSTLNGASRTILIHAGPRKYELLSELWSVTRDAELEKSLRYAFAHLS